MFSLDYLLLLLTHTWLCWWCRYNTEATWNS